MAEADLDLAAELTDLRAQLEASQASEARLREALAELLPRTYVHGHHQIDRDAWARGHVALGATEPNPLTAVVEAARLWASHRACLHDDTETKLWHSIAALDNTGKTDG